MILSHQIALDPTVKQGNALARAAGCARFAYNWGLVEWKRQYDAGLKPTANKIKKEFNKIKGTDFPWIYDSPKDANQQAFSDLGNAFSNFFDCLKGKRKGTKSQYPKPHKKGRNDSFYVSNDQFKISKNVIRLPVIGKVKMHEQLRLLGKIMSARVSRKADTWYVSVQVDGDFCVEPIADRRPIVGVDLGVKTAVVASNGRSFDSPKPLKAHLKKLLKAQRRLSRKKKGSSNRRKAARKVAKIHKRIADIRKDFCHKVTTQICRENQAIVIEDLNVKGMMRNHCLARAIADVGFGLIRQFFTYKVVKFGCELVVADRWYPSSKICSSCGAIKEHLGLDEREYVCEVCGVVEDRDMNAAVNLEMYPRLSGNKTPVDICASAQLHRVSAVDETGTNPCSLVSTS